jgi:hypothetical protein
LETLCETGDFSLSLSCWQESAREEQRQRSSQLGDDDDDDDYISLRSARRVSGRGGAGGRRSSSSASNNSGYGNSFGGSVGFNSSLGGGTLPDSYLDRNGIMGSTITMFPSLGSVMEGLGEEMGDTSPSSAQVETTSNTTSYNSTTASCRLSMSSSSTTSTTTPTAQSTRRLGVRHVHFEVPARLEQIEEFEKPDLEDYHLLYYMGHEIQKMIDDQRREDLHQRTIIR